MSANETVSEIHKGCFERDAWARGWGDSNGNLWKAVHKTGFGDDQRLRTDLSARKEILENGEVRKINRISGKEMMADCLMKKGASAKKLMDVLQGGKM